MPHAYRGRWFQVRVDPRQGAHPMEVVERTPAAVVAPVDAAGNLHLVRQYRHAAGAELVELPAGMVDPGEEPAAAALRELAEECALSAGSLEPLGSFRSSPGFTDEQVHLFLARDVRPIPGAAPDGEVAGTFALPLAEAVAMVERGAVANLAAAAAILLAARRLG